MHAHKQSGLFFSFSSSQHEKNTFSSSEGWGAEAKTHTFSPSPRHSKSHRHLPCQQFHPFLLWTSLLCLPWPPALASLPSTGEGSRHPLITLASAGGATENAAASANSTSRNNCNLLHQLSLFVCVVVLLVFAAVFLTLYGDMLAFPQLDSI